MFDKLKDKVSTVSDRIDEAGATKKAASAATGKRVIDTDKMDDFLQDLELQLISADVDRSVAEEIVSETEERLHGTKVSMVSSIETHVEDALRESIQSLIERNTTDLDRRIADADQPVSILFTGVNGVGKTTTIAKVAARLESQGYSTVIANGDTYRAAADEQAQVHADSIDVPLITHDDGNDPTAVVYEAIEYAEANEYDVVLADTAGRLHTDDGLMAQLEKIHRVCEPTFTLFVDEATAGQDAVDRANAFSQDIDTDGVVLTKTDATEDGGAVVSIPHSTGLPIAYIGTGEPYECIQELDAEEFANRVI